jgi:hypothetical protein
MDANAKTKTRKNPVKIYNRIFNNFSYENTVITEQKKIMNAMENSTPSIMSETCPENYFICK